MTTKVEKSILVNVPVSIVYNQWTQFEEFPRFMSGVKQVKQVSDDRLEWVAEIAGVRRQWTAKILEQVPDTRVSWAATEGATNAGAVSFEDVGGGQTSVHLSLEYEPEGLVEGIGDKLNLVEKQAEGDLKRFKEFIEAEGYASGAWRGSINDGAPSRTPGVEDAAASRGDKGKAGVSGAAVAAGAAVVAGGVAAAAAARKSSDVSADTDRRGVDDLPPVRQEASRSGQDAAPGATGVDDTTGTTSSGEVYPGAEDPFDDTAGGSTRPPRV